MNAYELDRRIVRAWSRRYGFGLQSRYERDAVRSYGTSKAKAVSAAKVGRHAKEASVLVMGDDLFSPDDQNEMFSLLADWKLSSRVLRLVTDRQVPRRHPFLARWRKRGVTTRLLKHHGSLGRSDIRMSRELSRGKFEKGLTLVWTGALRVAPSGLPAYFKSENQVVFVSMHAAPLRWKLAKERGWAMYSPNCYARLDTSPLLAIERRRIHEYSKGQALPKGRPEKSFWDAVCGISKRMRVPMPPRPKMVLSPFSSAGLQKILRVRPLSVRTFLIQRLMRGESACLPATRIILLSSLEIGHVAEEAAHYIRTVKSPHLAMNSSSIVREEAFAFFASRLFDRQRPIPLTCEPPGSSWANLHLQGYQLGAKLFADWERSGANRRKIRELWRTI